MSTATFFNALQTYLTGAWTDTTLAWENDGFDQSTQEDPWVFVEVYSETHDQMSIGAGSTAANLWRESGTVLFHVHVLQGSSSGHARAIGEALADLFRGQELAPGITFENIRGGAGYEDGRWWIFLLQVDWHRDS